MKKVNWGVLSTARIGVNKVIPAMQKSGLISVRAIGSRSLDAAEAAAKQLGIARAYGSYEEVINDPDIEAIYNPLPNHLHVPLTLAAARAGKHVLCEKPMALDAAEIDSLREVEDKVHIMEAFMVRHSLPWNAARDLVREGAIGRPHLIQSHFCYDNLDPDNIRNKVEWGGGGLMDIGCYPIVAGRFFFECEPQRVMALIDRDARFGTDVYTSGVIDFGSGRHLTFTVSTQAGRGQGVSVIGAKARVHIPIPFNAPPDQPNRFVVDDGATLDGSGAIVHTLPVSDQYTLMAEAFSKAIRGEAPLPYGLDDARANMRVIDALFRSERSGTWEALR